MKTTPPVGFHNYNHYPTGGLGFQSYTPENQRLEPPKSWRFFLEDIPKSWRFGSDGFFQGLQPKTPPKLWFSDFFAVHFLRQTQSFQGRQGLPRGPWSRRKTGLTSRSNDERPIANDARCSGGTSQLVKGVTLNGPMPNLFGICTCIYKNIYIYERKIFLSFFWVARSNGKLVEPLIYQTCALQWWFQWFFIEFCTYRNLGKWSNLDGSKAPHRHGHPVENGYPLCICISGEP